MNENRVVNNVSIIRIVVLALTNIVLLFCFIIRLFSWQILSGEEYKKISDIAASYGVKTEAVRGEIFDKNGYPIVKNTTAFNIVIDKLYLPMNGENEAIKQLVLTYEKYNEKFIDVLPIEIDKSGKYVFKEKSEEEIERLKSKDMLNMNSYSTAEECMSKLIARYELDSAELMTDSLKRSIVSVRYNMEISGYSMTQNYVFSEDASDKMIAIISEITQGNNGIRVESTYKRKIVDGTLAPHIIGTVGSLTAEEYEENKDKGYYYNDKIGKSGIEYAMEKFLRGTGGTKYLTRLADGEIIESKESIKAEPGNTVYLTLDANLQKVANKSLAENIRAAQKAGKSTSEKGDGEDCTSGAVVAINVKDFSVIAAASYPNYDLSKYSNYDYYTKLINDKNVPLYNRAFNGIYAPGSIFKPCVAAAALEEKLIEQNEEIFCKRTYDYYKSDPVNCMFYHGDIDLKTAITKSCNYYFAEVGRRLGIDTMYLYAERFGLGVNTGIEVYESTGILAGRDASIWHDSNTTKAAIGQSDNAFTPIQLATYAATIANNGKRLRTHIVDKVVSYDGKETIFDNSDANTEIVAETGISEENMKIVKDAMLNVTQSSYGTGNSVFGDYKIKVAAKTGTAENSGSDHVTFICFAPYDDPQIALAVVLEHGHSGKYSMSVAKAVLNAYFDIK